MNENKIDDMISSFGGDSGKSTGMGTKRGEDGLSAELERNYDKLGEDDINKFVEGARAANNADATEDADVTKDAPC
ncbi:MAG: hypothetical protein NC124_17385 [Clostridium sp.]|nr:hypothetical protein [Clostridium sp.]